MSVAKRTPARPDDALYARVLDIVEAARKHAARSVNSAMVYAYWLIGREIVVAEQAGAQRAGYGEEVIERLSQRLTRRLGKGFGARTLWRLRQFHQLYPRGSAIAGARDSDRTPDTMSRDEDSDNPTVRIRARCRGFPVELTLVALPRAPETGTDRRGHAALLDVLTTGCR